MLQYITLFLKLGLAFHNYTSAVDPAHVHMRLGLERRSGPDCRDEYPQDLPELARSRLEGISVVAHDARTHVYIHPMLGMQNSLRDGSLRVLDFQFN